MCSMWPILLVLVVFCQCAWSNRVVKLDVRSTCGKTFHLNDNLPVKVMWPSSLPTVWLSYGPGPVPSECVVHIAARIPGYQLLVAHEKKIKIPNHGISLEIFDGHGTESRPKKKYTRTISGRNLGKVMTGSIMTLRLRVKNPSIQAMYSNKIILVVSPISLPVWYL